MLRKVFTKDNKVIAVSVIGSMEMSPNVTHIQTDEFQIVSDDSILVESGYSFIGGVYQKPVEQVVAPEDIKVSPVEFKLLFTAAERVAMKLVRATDPVIDDFFDIVEDPRLTHVNLSLSSTIAAVGYLETVRLIAPGRKEEILSGTMQ